MISRASIVIQHLLQNLDCSAVGIVTFHVWVELLHAGKVLRPGLYLSVCGELCQSCLRIWQGLAVGFIALLIRLLVSRIQRIKWLDVVSKRT